MFDNLPNISRAKEKRQNMLKTSCCLVERSSMEAPSGCGALSISAGVTEKLCVNFQYNQFLPFSGFLLLVYHCLFV